MYDIEGFEDYQVDDEKRVFRKPTVLRAWKSKKYAPGCQMKTDRYGKYTLRRKGNPHRLSPEDVFALRKPNGGK